MKADLARNSVGAAVTFDGWTSLKTVAFYTATAHWADADFNLHSAVLAVDSLPGSHTHDVIGNWVLDVLKRYDLLDKVFNVTTDNAEPCVKAVTDIVKKDHSRCFDHSLQLIVKNALEDHEALIAKTRGLVGSFHHSPQKAGALTAMQKALSKPETKLGQDTPTRWQSTWLMIDSVLRSADAIKAVQGQFVDEDKQLSDKEFSVLRELAAGLQPYHDVSKHMEGQQYPTMNELLPNWFALVDDAEDYQGTRCARGGLADGLIREMDNRSDKIASKASRLSCLLDPRFRQLRFFEQKERDSAKELLKAEYKEESIKLQAETVRAAAEVQSEQGDAMVVAGDDKEIKDSKDAKRDGNKDRKNANSDKEAKSGKEPKDGPWIESGSGSRGVKRSASDVEKGSGSGSGSGSKAADERPEKRAKVVERALAKFADVPVTARSEIDDYFDEPAAPDAKPLDWWRARKHRFPVLARLARKYLAVPATSAPSERVWSDAGNIVTKKRASLSDANVDTLVFLHGNIEFAKAVAQKLQAKAKELKKQSKKSEKKKMA